MDWIHEILTHRIKSARELQRGDPKTVAETARKLALARTSETTRREIGRGRLIPCEVVRPVKSRGTPEEPMSGAWSSVTSLWNGYRPSP
jgi:hypothetical protein